MSYDSGVSGKPLRSRPRPTAHNTMSLFIPPNQLQNMLDAEIGQALCGRPNLGKMIALSALQQSNQVRHQSQLTDNWLEPNWMDDPDWV